MSNIYKAIVYNIENGNIICSFKDINCKNAVKKAKNWRKYFFENDDIHKYQIVTRIEQENFDVTIIKPFWKDIKNNVKQYELNV